MDSGNLASRHKAVLVVIDEQERLTLAMAHRERVVAATGRLVRVAALVGVPVILTRQYPAGLGDVDSALDAAVEMAEAAGLVAGVVDKVAFDCFDEPAFREALESTGRSQIVVAGMETHVCVVQTSLSARGAGWEVQVASDACCSRADQDHDVSLDRMRHAGVVVTTSESAMYELVGQAATDEFRALLAVVKGAESG